MGCTDQKNSTVEDAPSGIGTTSQCYTTQMVAINSIMLQDANGTIWEYTPLEIGAQYRVCLDSKGTLSVFDDEILSVKKVAVSGATNK